MIANHFGADVARPFHTAKDWTVDPSLPHSEARKIGKQRAVEYLHGLMLRPDRVGMSVLGQIASTIDYDDHETKAYWIGFFSQVERMLAHRCLPGKGE